MSDKLITYNMLVFRITPGEKRLLEDPGADNSITDLDAAREKCRLPGATDWMIFRNFNRVTSSGQVVWERQEIAESTIPR